MDELATVNDQAMLPGWLATATLRECGRVLRAAGRQQAAEYMLDAGDIPGGSAGMVEHELQLAERRAALRAAFTHLPPDCQQLIAMLIEDPPVPDAEISARLGIPAWRIGPRPCPLPGAAAPLSGRRRPDQRRSPGRLNA